LRRIVADRPSGEVVTSQGLDQIPQGLGTHWLDAVAPDDPEKLQRRFVWDGIDLEAMTEVLDDARAGAITDEPAGPKPLDPDWDEGLRLIREALSQHWDFPLLPYVADSPERQLPFVDLWLPAIVAAISLNAERHPINAKISPVPGFTSEALADWARQHLSSSCFVLSDGLACFRSVAAAGRSHAAVVTGGRHPNDLPEFRWINILLSNLRTSFSGTFHAFYFDKYAKRYLGCFCFRFNRRFNMAEMTERIANAVCFCKPCPERVLRVVEHYV
jgi:hypothetical protein